MSRRVTRPWSWAALACLTLPAQLPQGGPADSLAFATLSATQRALLDVRRDLGSDTLQCVSLGATSRGQERRRLQGRLPDGSSLVIFARWVPATVEIHRVEFVRTTEGQQRGMTWDRDGNSTTAVDWNADRSRAVPYPVPSGGPVPQVLRALARRVIARCG